MSILFETPFKLRQEEILASAAITLLLRALHQQGVPECEVKDICEKPQYGFTTSALWDGVGVRFLRITDVKAGKVDWSKVPYCKCDEPEKYQLKKNDILIARSGSVGKTFLVENIPELTVFASYMIRLRVQDNELVDPQYLYWCLQSEQFWQQVMAVRRGSAMKNINAKMLQALAFPIPRIELQHAIFDFLNTFSSRLWGNAIDLSALPTPLKEQRRIVARIEALTGKVEEARRLREEATAEAEQLWGAVARKLILEKTDAEICELDDLVNMVGGGTPSKRNAAYWEGSIPWFSPKDMKVRELHDSQDHITKLATKNSSAKIRPEGSVLIVVRGMILAHTVPSAVLRVPAAVNQDIKVLIPSEYLVPEYLCNVLWALNSDLLALIERSTHGTCKLLTPKLLGFRIPVPPISEQYNIVSYLNKVQEKVGAIRHQQAVSQLELDALLPAILDKAFKGEL